MPKFFLKRDCVGKLIGVSLLIIFKRGAAIHLNEIEKYEKKYAGD
jgi:hypothetical protein